mgnify:CR=1 FL=1
MTLKAADVESKLIHKFKFTKDNSDHRKFTLEVPGQALIFTIISHSHRDISAPILSSICKQLRVRKHFFLEMIQCTKSREDYLWQITNDPYPPFDG